MMKTIEHYVLDSKEYSQIDNLIGHIQKIISSENDLYHIAQYAIQKLPHSLRTLMTEYQNGNQQVALYISGFHVDDNQIGATPDNNCPNLNRPVMREEIYLTLMGSCLGTPFSFASQQGGHLTQNIIPMKSAEFSQLGAGSKDELVWHTEDAFTDKRPDFLLLFGMRNPLKVATTVAVLPPETSKEDINALFAENFYFLPDPDHASHLANTTCKAERETHQRMQEMLNNPKKGSILFGDPVHPCLRLDPKFMKPVCTEDKSWAAYNRLVERIDAAQQDIVINQGELLIVNNHRAVHGRRAFNTHYDGHDRWIKKINIRQKHNQKQENPALQESSFVIW
ncbi:MAG: TauD/TfdA family dioxygenase [Enterobacteriaceae bacterium]